MELAQVEDCQKRKTNKAPVAADKLHYLLLHDSGTLPQMNGAQSLNEWDGWKLKCFGRSFELPCQRFLWRPSQWEKTHTLDEATSSDCACGVLASLDHPKSSVLTGSDRHSLLEHSLPVATALVEFWSRWTTLNLAFFSVQPRRKHKMILGSMIPAAPLEHSLPVASVLTGSDRHSLLEHSLPVASVLVEFFRRWGTINLAFFSLRPRRKHKIIPGSRAFPKGSTLTEHSLPVASVLTGSEFPIHYRLERAILRAPHWQNSQFTTGSERSEGFPIHYR